MKKESIYFTTYQLKERMWKESVIKKLLPEPDDTYTNPKYKSAPPGKLYLKRKVYGKERTKIFKKFLEKREEREKRAIVSAKKAVVTKINNNIQNIEDIKINVEKLKKEKLYKNAIKHYNFLQMEREFNYKNHEANHIGDISNLDSSFLERITLNYIRHNLTNYDEELFYSISNRIGKDMLYEMLNNKIDDSILKIYPFMNQAIINRNNYKGIN